MPSLWKTHKIGQARVRAQSGSAPRQSEHETGSSTGGEALESDASSSAPGSGSPVERTFWRRTDRRHARGEVRQVPHSTTEPAPVTAEGQAADGIEEWRRQTRGATLGEDTADTQSDRQSQKITAGGGAMTTPGSGISTDGDQSSDAGDRKVRIASAGFGKLPKRRKLTIDEAMEESIGEFGRGQQLLFFLAQLSRVPVACLTVLMVFTNLDPVALRHFACTPGPAHDNCEELLEGSGDAGDLHPSFCSLPANATTWTEPQRSVVSEFDLTCNERWLQFLADTAFLTAFVVGGFLFDAMSHWMGRKASVITTCLVAGVFGVGTGAAQGYWTYLGLRTLSGIGCAGTTAGAFLLSLEYVGPSWETFLNVSSQMTWSLGLLITATAAYAIPDWRNLYFLFGGLVLLCLLWVPLLPESPPWLMATNHRDEALSVLRKIANSNETEMPKASIHASKPKSEVAEKDAAETLWTVLRSRSHCLRLLSQLTASFVIALMYYGSIWATPDLSGNIYLNNALMAVFEIPSFFGAAVALRRFGRRNTIAYVFIAGGIFSLATALPTPSVVQTALAVLAKMGAAAASSILHVYTAELFPTSVRRACVGLCSVSAGHAIITVPYLLYAARFTPYPLLSYAVMGGGAVASGALLLHQPETRDQPQFQTIAEERFIEEHLYHPRIGKDPENFDDSKMETRNSGGGLIIASIHGPLHLSRMPME